MKTGVALTASGFGLVALCYGLARFAFGLFLPAMREDLPLSDTLAGVIAGGAFGGCTSAGVALSGPVALALGADWRSAYLLFAALGLLVALACIVAVLAGNRRPPFDPDPTATGSVLAVREDASRKVPARE